MAFYGATRRLRKHRYTLKWKTGNSRFLQRLVTLWLPVTGLGLSVSITSSQLHLPWVQFLMAVSLDRYHNYVCSCPGLGFY